MYVPRSSCEMLPELTSLAERSHIGSKLHWRAKRMHVTNDRASQLDARFLHYFSADYQSKRAIRESYLQYNSY